LVPVPEYTDDFLLPVQENYADAASACVGGKSNRIFPYDFNCVVTDFAAFADARNFFYGSSDQILSIVLLKIPHFSFKRALKRMSDLVAKQHVIADYLQRGPGNEFQPPGFPKLLLILIEDRVILWFFKNEKISRFL
jgi:hypothetical protein